MRLATWIAFLVACLGAGTACAASTPDSLTLYTGKYTDQRLAEDILGNRALHFENSWIVAGAWARTFSESENHRWEIEGQVVKHMGRQTHWEFNGLVIWRWTEFPWNAYLKTTVAVGDGLSYATEVPPLELESHTNTGAARLLDYFVLETTFAPPWADNWALVTRVHHRSGVKGLFGDVHGGSNIIAVGIKLYL